MCNELEYIMIQEMLQKMKQKEQQKKVEKPIEVAVHWITLISIFPILAKNSLELEIIFNRISMKYH